MPLSSPKHIAPTGNGRRFTALISGLFTVAAMLVVASTLPTDKKPAEIVSSSEPAVQGAVRDIPSGEFVPEDEVKPPEEPAGDLQNAYYPVVSISDGDTIRVRMMDRIETIRLIGVDTPETRDPRRPVQCYGKEASAFTTKLLSGKNVRLENDTSQQNRDRYGRLLRYVFLQDGTHINLELIKNGYAYEYTFRDAYTYQSSFRAAQDEASLKQVGLWSPSTCNGNR